MHSRIIELGNEPILPDDRMGECSVPEWFYHSIADYTDEETDREEDLKHQLVDFVDDGVVPQVDDPHQVPHRHQEKQREYHRKRGL